MDAGESLRYYFLMKIPYETFEHEADIGIRGFGDSLEESFAHAAAAMYSVVVDVGNVEPRERRSITVSAPERDLLLVEWLNALLAVSDIDRLVFSKFAVSIRGNELAGEAWGEPLDRMKHRPRVEVKGATYHMLHVGTEEGRFVAQCVVDV
ncbi:MAG: archease [Nitrospiraceae bacterium]|nr:archease [Nitrospiraceae bacterium]